MSMIIQKIPINKINPAAYNPRKDLQSDDPEYQKLKKSIEEFDLVEPLIWNKQTGNLVGGHQRLKVLIEQGIKEVDVSVVDLPDSKEKALNIALNKISGDWDLPKLKDLLQEIDTGEFDIEITGFDEKEIEDLMNQLYTPDENEKDDDVPEVPEEPITKKGDLYKLGEHRLLCGDATKIDDVERLMDGHKAELLFTSPPYSDMRTYGGGKDLSIDYLIEFIPSFLSFVEYQVINLGLKRENGEIIQYWNDYITKAKDCGYKFLSWNVWVKQNAGSIGNQSAFIPIIHEWIFVFGKDFKNINRIENRKTEPNPNRLTRKVRQPDGSMNISSVGEQKKFKEMESVYFTNSELGKIRSEHPATFPVDLPTKYIGSITDKNDIVVDCFGGSGSTLIACEKLNRKCFMMELDEHYCDVIVKRWEDYTGKKAELL